MFCFYITNVRCRVRVISFLYFLKLNKTQTLITNKLKTPEYMLLCFSLLSWFCCVVLLFSKIIFTYLKNLARIVKNKE